MKKAKLVSEITRYLGELEEVLPEEEQFFKDKLCQYGISMLMLNIINGCIDLGTEVINTKQLGYPEKYKDIFNILETKKIIGPALAKRLRNLVSLRNLLAHEYGEIDLGLLYESAKELRFVEEYVNILVKHL